MPAESGIIEFWSASGAPCAQTQIALLIPNSGQDYNRVGWFGTTGPGSFIVINTYNDTTYIVNEDGNPSGAFTSSGKLNNCKYVNATSVNPNSSGSQAVSGLPEHAATLRIEFTEPSGNAVTTQNVYLKAIKLNNASGCDDENVKVSGMLIQAFEVVPTVTGWTLISQTGTNNYIQCSGRSTASIVHHYHVALSVSPLQTGERIDFGILFKLEYV